MLSQGQLPELMFKHRALVAEVREHNCAVIVRRRQGGAWEAAENQYRDAVAEALALEEAAA